MPTTTETFRKLPSVDELLAQIGRMNLMAISGGRYEATETGVILPVGNGYSVTVDYDWDDTYVVRRVFTRSAIERIKGEVRGVFCDEVGEQAYQASSFRSYDYPKGT